MSDVERRQQAVDKNFAAFKRLLPELVKTHPGKFALIRDEQIVEIFDTARDAMIYGQKEYPDSLFSIQQVTDTVVDLGYFSHAVHINPVRS